MQEENEKKDLQDEIEDQKETVRKIELSKTAWMTYIPNFLTQAHADALFEELLATEDWEHRAIVVADKEILQPRLMSWAGDLPYRYTGQTLEPRKMSDTLKNLCEMIEKECGCSFNHIVLNYYRDGKDHIGMHADDEQELGWDPTIAALSLGDSRSFVVEPKSRKVKKRPFRINLKHASLLIMGGDIQHRFRHGVPKNQSEKPRINVTFRFLKGPPGTQRPPHPYIKSNPYDLQEHIDSKEMNDLNEN